MLPTTKGYCAPPQIPWGDYAPTDGCFGLSVRLTDRLAGFIGESLDGSSWLEDPSLTLTITPSEGFITVEAPAPQGPARIGVFMYDDDGNLYTAYVYSAVAKPEAAFLHDGRHPGPPTLTVVATLPNVPFATLVDGQGRPHAPDLKDFIAIDIQEEDRLLEAWPLEETRTRAGDPLRLTTVYQLKSGVALPTEITVRVVGPGMAWTPSYTCPVLWETTQHLPGVLLPAVVGGEGAMTRPALGAVPSEETFAMRVAPSATVEDCSFEICRRGEWVPHPECEAEAVRTPDGSTLIKAPVTRYDSRIAATLKLPNGQAVRAYTYQLYRIVTAGTAQRSPGTGRTSLTVTSTILTGQLPTVVDLDGVALAPDLSSLLYHDTPPAAATGTFIVRRDASVVGGLPEVTTVWELTDDSRLKRLPVETPGPPDRFVSKVRVRLGCSDSRFMPGHPLCECNVVEVAAEAPPSEPSGSANPTIEELYARELDKVQCNVA
jgi:hypothetical protein